MKAERTFENVTSRKWNTHAISNTNGFPRVGKKALQLPFSTSVEMAFDAFIPDRMQQPEMMVLLVNDREWKIVGPFL